MSTGEVTILKGDARDLDLPDDSVDLIVTSPPYFGLRSYQDGGEHYDGQIGAEATPTEFVDALIECTREWMRVVKPTGSIFVNVGDKYSTYEHRPGGNPGSNQWATASQRAHRYTRNAPAAYGVPYKSLMGIPWRYALRCIDKSSIAPSTVPAASVHSLLDMVDEGTASLDYIRGVIDEMESPAATGGLGLILRQELIWSKGSVAPTRLTDRARRTHEHFFHFTKREKYFSSMDDLREGEGLAFPESVRRIPPANLRAPSELGSQHHAIFPTEWPRWIIEGWCPPGGVVLDPFGGTGTTALVASTLGRHGISVDMSADYCRIAEWRTTDPKQRAKAARKPYTPPAEQTPGQLDLFDMGDAS